MKLFRRIGVFVSDENIQSPLKNPSLVGNNSAPGAGAVCSDKYKFRPQRSTSSDGASRWADGEFIS